MKLPGSILFLIVIISIASNSLAASYSSNPRSTNYCPKVNTTIDVEEHDFTKRGLYRMEQTMPPFMNLNQYKNRALGTLNVLEIGCGNGRALLDLQAVLPNSYTWCVNKKGYGFSQVETKITLIGLIHRYKIQVPCDISGEYVLPKVELIDGLQVAPLPYKDNTFDVILSQHALNVGKLYSYEAKAVISRTISKIKSNGIASFVLLDLLTDYNKTFSTIPQSYIDEITTKYEFKPMMIRSVKSNALRKTFSIVLYTVNKFIGLFIQRCPDDKNFFQTSTSTRQLRRSFSNRNSSILLENLSRKEWGCIDTSSFTNKQLKQYIEDLNFFTNILTSLPAPKNQKASKKIKTSMPYHYLYNRDYISHLVRYLDRISMRPSFKLDPDDLKNE